MEQYINKKYEQGPYCQRPSTVGRGTTSGRHDLGFPTHASRAPTHAGRSIQRHSPKGREEEQGTNLPRTPPGPAMPPCCVWN